MKSPPLIPRVPEKVIQAQIVTLLRSIGAKVYVFGVRRRRDDYQGTMQTPGAADLEAYVPFRNGSGHRMVKIEVKADGGRPSAEQRALATLCRSAKVDYICGGVDDVVAWLIAGGWLARDSVPHYRLDKAGPRAYPDT